MLNRAIPRSFDRIPFVLVRQGVSLFLASDHNIAPHIKRLVKVVAVSFSMSPLAIKAEVQNGTTHFKGDLGGVPVSIIRDISSTIKYENGTEQGWRSPKDLTPSHNDRAKISSFEFLAKYPEIRMMRPREMMTNISDIDAFETPWMAVQILSGSQFPGQGFMEKEFLSNGETKSREWWNNFEIKPNKKYELTEYRLNGVNPKTGQHVREGRENDVVYIFRDSDEKVRARIDFHENILGPVECKHKWSMEYQGMAAQVIVIYRPEFVHDWSKIQRHLTQIILNFRAGSSVMSEAPAPPADATVQCIKR